MTKNCKKEVLKVIKESCGNQPIVVPLADTVRDMMDLGRRKNELYLLGAMGMPLSIATGIAMGLRKKNVKKNVVCIEGDGGLLMNVNSLLTVKYLGIKNLVVVLLDNESYLTTGKQPTYSSMINLGSLAEELGFTSFCMDDIGQFTTVIKDVRNADKGPYFLHVKVSKDTSTSPISFDNPAVLLEQFHRYLESLTDEVV